MMIVQLSTTHPDTDTDKDSLTQTHVHDTNTDTGTDTYVRARTSIAMCAHSISNDLFRVRTVSPVGIHRVELLGVCVCVCVCV